MSTDQRTTLCSNRAIADRALSIDAEIALSVKTRACCVATCTTVVWICLQVNANIVAVGLTSWTIEACSCVTDLVRATTGLVANLSSTFDTVAVAAVTGIADCRTIDAAAAASVKSLDRIHARSPATLSSSLADNTTCSAVVRTVLSADAAATSSCRWTLPVACTTMGWNRIQVHAFAFTAARSRRVRCVTCRVASIAADCKPRFLHTRVQYIALVVSVAVGSVRRAVGASHRVSANQSTTTSLLRYRAIGAEEITGRTRAISLGSGAW